MNKDKKHILVVDDEPDIINIIGIILNRTGSYEVSGAANGIRALDFLSQDATVDLVLADIKMPEMDGVELLDKIKENDLERPKIMFVTGFTDVPIDKLYAAGACGFITKPFEWKVVLSSVAECLKEKPRYDKPYSEKDIKMTVQASSDDFALGTGGVFINILQKRVGIGDLVRFKIDLKKGEIDSIDGVGEIMWQRVTTNDDILIGVKFHNLKPELEDFVEDLCRKNKVRAFIPMRK